MNSPDWPEEEYPCLGICEMDPETGYCLGCGRPPDYYPPVVPEIDSTAPAKPDPLKPPQDDQKPTA